MSKKRSLHAMIDTEVYEKLRHVCFYERTTMAEVIRRLLAEYLEEKALDELDCVSPQRL